MGLFDSVMVTCRKCSHRNELQSKAGDSYLSTYELYNAPPEVAVDIAGRHACEECGEGYTVVAQVITGVLEG